MGKRRRIAALGALLLVWAAPHARASEHEPKWAQTERKQNPLVDVKIYKDGKGGIQAYARTDMGGQFIEVIAFGTNDPKMAVSDSHAISLALATARAIAYEKLAERVGEVRVDSRTLLKTQLINVKVVKLKVSEVIRGARILEEKYNLVAPREVRAVVKLGLLISGGRNNLLGPIYSPAALPAIRKNAGNLTLYRPPSPAARKPAKPKRFTSLIVDASGLSAAPAIFPRLVAGKGPKVVYNENSVEKRVFLRRESIVKYASSMAAAQKNYADLLGKEPLIVRAKKAVGKMKTDLELSSEDANAVLAADVMTGFLKKAQVVLIVN